MRSLDRGGAREAAKDAPIGDTELQGLSRSQMFAAGVAAPKDAFGVDVMQPGASAQLARIINGFTASGAEDAMLDLTPDHQVMEGLSKLAMLGTSLSA